MCNTPFPFHLPCSLSLVFHLLLRPKQNNFSRKADHITSQSLQTNKRTEGAPRVLLHLWLHRARFVFSTWSRMSFLFLSPSSWTALIHLFTRELFNCSWLSNPRSPNIFVSAQNEFHTNQMKWKMNRKNKKNKQSNNTREFRPSLNLPCRPPASADIHWLNGKRNINLTDSTSVCAKLLKKENFLLRNRRELVRVRESFILFFVLLLTMTTQSNPEIVGWFSITTYRRFVIKWRQLVPFLRSFF